MLSGRSGGERVVGMAAVMVGRRDLLRAGGRMVFGAGCARRGLSTRLVFGARLWPGLYSGGRVPQEVTLGGFCEPWARLLLVGAAGDKPMGIHKRGPHGGLCSCGCREGGPGLGGVVRSLFRGFGLLLLEGVVRAANPATVFGQGGCSFGCSLTGDSKANEGGLVSVARADTVDAELDRLISERASQDRRPDPDEQEEAWKQSARAYEEKRRQMARYEWHLYHTAQAERVRRTLEDLVSHHEGEAARLMDIKPKGAASPRTLRI